MARGRQSRAGSATAARRQGTRADSLRSAADDFLARFGGLVDEIVALREALEATQEENLRLRTELDEGIALFRDARDLVARAEAPARRGRGRARSAAEPPAGKVRRARAVAAGRNGRRARNSDRATPPEVTADVVRAVIGRMGTATASEIAAEIARAGTPVSGRAIRHIARVAGAVARPGDDGRMVYALS
jgi:hypothetical protein